MDNNWGSHLTFDISQDDAVMDEITDWLEERGVRKFILRTMALYGLPEEAVLILPEGCEEEAALISLMEHCTGVAKISP